MPAGLFNMTYPGAMWEHPTCQGVICSRMSDYVNASRRCCHPELSLLLAGMFNVSYPGAAPNLNRASLAGPPVEGPTAEGTSGSPKQTKADMFTCPICFEELHKHDVFVSSMCGHEMCRGCARQMVLTAIRCPFCPDAPNIQ